MSSLCTCSKLELESTNQSNKIVNTKVSFEMILKYLSILRKGASAKFTDQKTAKNPK